MRENILYLSTIMGAGLGYLLGGLDGFLYALIIFMLIDYITGIMIGINKKQISSQIGYKGIFKKCTILLMIIVANIVDVQILKEGDVVRTAVIFFYISNEGISILENVNKLGVPIPKKLVKILQTLDDELGIDQEIE